MFQVGSPEVALSVRSVLSCRFL